MELQATVDENKRKNQKQLEILDEMNDVYEKLQQVHNTNFAQQNTKIEVLNKK